MANVYLIVAVFLLATVIALSWRLLKIKAELEREKAKPLWAQFELAYPQPARQEPERIKAVMSVPSGTPEKTVEAGLANMLAKQLPNYWTVKKEVDYDVEYTASVWVLPKEE